MRYTALGCCALLLMLVCTVSGARDLDQDQALRLRQQGLILPLDQLMQAALARHPGAVLLEAELEDDDGVLKYEVELVTSDGVVREIELSASTGAVIKDEVED
ncbi:PepSY domain-containing protein [Ectopseudomonas mendocina]|uniref:PepSY domain-containing protein n=1 Tax=Ectopseudomonas mendocina TaxID=300 RepID=A0ABZ2RAM8_ECTME